MKFRKILFVYNNGNTAYKNSHYHFNVKTVKHRIQKIHIAYELRTNEQSVEHLKLSVFARLREQ